MSITRIITGSLANVCPKSRKQIVDTFTMAEKDEEEGGGTEAEKKETKKKQQHTNTLSKSTCFNVQKISVESRKKFQK